MSSEIPPPISRTIVAALTQPVQTNFATLITELGWKERGVLEALLCLRDILQAWQIECEPPIGELGLEDDRIIKRSSADDPLQLVMADIALGEGNTIEWKETILLDVKKHAIGGKPLSECYSERVLLSSLKTIAAFLNSTGGTLLVGVNDIGEITGIEKEFSLIPGAKKLDFDEWELYLRTLIEKYFHNGRSITSSIQVTRAQHANGIVARIVVGPRRGLCIMKSTELGDQLFIRAGNRTLSVGLTDLEEYFSLSKSFV
ncbi:ATP-binding protein [Phyllobacterium sp. 21LDTY02-6]|uniref:AlbA family DNA-binding domain-containing protein n=1 Tax=Phyllobacterium sp. 21LDTY02-6 TaxID=2944903 RepID=UPI002020903F|nr:ATP-binding protein [Phyllobacterium sp. 21LDTY02-6]MCO4317321.1 ATP-binding protein [Phyllobacterium sp. 21LDTY02-6]